MHSQAEFEDIKGTFGTVVYESIRKKDDLFSHNFWKYALRSVFATLFLTMGTAVAMQSGQIANGIAPGLGKFTFAFLFAWSLVMIVYMDGELATSNMMFMTVGTQKKYVSFGRGAKILMTCVLFNMLGGILFAWMMAQTSIFQNMPADHFLYTAVSAKFAKTPWIIFMEGIFANVAVNTAVFSSNRMTNGDGRVISIIFIIFIFAFLGDEHVIANFCSFPLAFFANGGAIPGMTVGSVLTNYVMTFLGNFVGGGLLIGWGYYWLNKNEAVYLD